MGGLRMATLGFQQLSRIPLSFAPYTDSCHSEGPGMVIRKPYWLLWVWLPHQAVVLENGVFPKE